MSKFVVSVSLSDSTQTTNDFVHNSIETMRRAQDGTGHTTDGNEYLRSTNKESRFVLLFQKPTNGTAVAVVLANYFILTQRHAEQNPTYLVRVL